jgi:hypothetical protein
MRLTARWLFSILLFLGLFLMTLRPIADPDFWWHLRTGQLIAQTHLIPHSDPYSFTNNGKPWVAHEWLSELLIYGLYCLGSYGLLIFTFSLLITTGFLFTYLRCPPDSRPYIAGFSLLLGAIATAPTWGVRPQMLSLLLTSLLLYLLDRYRDNANYKYLIPIPAITLLWVNLHAGYFLGLGIVGIYIVGGTIEILTTDIRNKSDPVASKLKPILILCAVLGISILASLANPNGIHIILYPFQTLASSAMQQFIQEWFSPDFHLLEWQPLAWFFLALIGAGMLGKKPIAPTKILLVLIFGYATLVSMRHVPLFAIVAIPILAEQIGGSFLIHSEAHKTGIIFKWIAPLVIALLLAVVGLRFVQVIQGQVKSEMETFPKGAVDWIQVNQPQRNLFNSYGWGGYLIWRLYPSYLVYIDGRADVYGDDFIYSYTDNYRGQPSWIKAFVDRSVNLVLVEPGSGLANALSQASGWEIVYEDSLSVIYARN